MNEHVRIPSPFEHCLLRITVIVTLQNITIRKPDPNGTVSNQSTVTAPRSHHCGYQRTSRVKRTHAITRAAQTCARCIYTADVCRSLLLDNKSILHVDDSVVTTMFHYLANTALILSCTNIHERIVLRIHLHENVCGPSVPIPAAVGTMTVCAHSSPAVEVVKTPPSEPDDERPPQPAPTRISERAMSEKRFIDYALRAICSKAK